MTDQKQPDAAEAQKMLDDAVARAKAGKIPGIDPEMLKFLGNPPADPAQDHHEPQPSTTPACPKGKQPDGQCK